MQLRKVMKKYTDPWIGSDPQLCSDCINCTNLYRIVLSYTKYREINIIARKTKINIRI
jgi:hypothetical protein